MIGILASLLAMAATAGFLGHLVIRAHRELRPVPGATRAPDLSPPLAAALGANACTLALLIYGLVLRLDGHADPACETIALIVSPSVLLACLAGDLAGRRWPALGSSPAAPRRAR